MKGYVASWYHDNTKSALSHASKQLEKVRLKNKQLRTEIKQLKNENDKLQKEKLNLQDELYMLSQTMG